MTMKKGKCRHCGIVPITIEKPNHILHLLLAICTGGLWLFVWILLKSKVTCNVCGSPARELNFFDNFTKNIVNVSKSIRKSESKPILQDQTNNLLLIKI